MRNGLFLLIILCIQFTFGPSAGAITLYDVNFSSPPHVVSQPPVLGGGLPPRNTPSYIWQLTTAPVVQQSQGTLTDQPCVFRVAGTAWYSQLYFYLPPQNGGFNAIYPRYILEMDLYIEKLEGQYNDFRLLFDAPTVRNLYFYPNGNVTIYNSHDNIVIGRFTLGQTISLKIDVDLKKSTWKIWLDGNQIYSGPFYSSTLEDIRISLGDRTDCRSGNIAAVDNIKVYGITEPADINFDNAADMNDISDFAANWLEDSCRQINGCDNADIDDSNAVDFVDFANLSSGWLKPANILSVDAGSDQLINYPSLSVNLDGTIDDDGLPNPPGVVTGQWSKASGPGTVTFGNSNAADTTASFSQPGVYVLRLTANDGQLLASDTMAVRINQTPTVDAGRDIIIAYPYNEIPIEGIVSDDGLPSQSALKTQWTQQSGPGEVFFYDANSTWTFAIFPEFGTYVLRLTADDGVFSVYDEMRVKYYEVLPDNQAPDVNAGADQLVYDIWAQLSGTATDDGLPDPPGQVSFIWTQQSGPEIWFDNPNGADTWVNFPDYGIYVLRLTANDGELDSYDEITITCQEPGINQAPVVWAGDYQEIVFPDSVLLEGWVDDDGLPNPPRKLTTQWSKESGPGTVTFADANSLSTTAIFSQPGEYELRLTANDTELTSYGYLTIICTEKAE